MSRPRIELQSLLEDILGSRNVYFQPPESIRMKYPAIVYRLNSVKNRFADDISYSRNKAYRVTVIDKNPDTAIPDRIAELPLCRFDNYFISDNLNHYVFTIYY